MLRTVICQDVGKFWSQELTRSMERESVAAVPCLVLRKVRPPLVSQAQSHPHGVRWGKLGCKRNILVA